MAQDQGKYAYSSTLATAVLNAVPGTGGMLKRVIIGTGGTTSVLTIYDNTAASGTIIATISTLAVESLEFNLQYSNGLTIVQSGGAAALLTVVYT